MLVLAIIVLEVPLALSLRDRVDQEVSTQARTVTDAVASVAGAAIEDGSQEQLTNVVEGAAESARGRVLVVDEKGEVLVDSAGEAATGSDVSARPEIAASLAGRTIQLDRRSETLDRGLIATSAPVYHDGRLVGAVRVTQSVDAQDDAVERSIAGLAIVGLIVLTLGLIVGWFIARAIARPLGRFEAAARAVADGDLDARAPVEGSDEQRSLAITFNEMADRLSGSLQAQSRFVADASHQLRTPLTGLRLRLESARANANDPQLSEDLDAGMVEVDRMARTVDELLVLSQTGERDARSEPLDLGELAEAAAERWRPIAAETDHEVSFERGDQAVQVTASRADLDRVLDALVENAVAYSPPGSAIEIAASGGAVSVCDHGPGVGEDPEALFDRFSRGEAGKTRSGTGLGLAIAKELVARWGGTVELQNAEGGGTVATISFAGGPR